VASILVAALSAYVSPWALRELRRWANEARADFVGNIAVPGQFTTLLPRVTLHIRQREANGQLLGVFIDDQRDDKERVTMLAERGNIVKTNRGTYLVLENGSAQRHEAARRDPTIVLFDSYGFDLSEMIPTPTNVKYSTRERFLWELYNPIPGDPLFNDSMGQVRAELHDRLTAPLYPLAFVFVTFAYLGAPRTTRQSRATSLAGAIGVMTLLRALGFVGMIVGVNNPAALAIPYVALGAAFVLGYLAILRGIIIEPPTVVVNAISAVTERIARRIEGMMRQTA
jgi:lipopolysaccharide export system permease protein